MEHGGAPGLPSLTPQVAAARDADSSRGRKPGAGLWRSPGILAHGFSRGASDNKRQAPDGA